MQKIPIDIGTDLTFTLQLADSTGENSTGFTDADIPEAQVWIGGDQPSLFSPTCTWLDSTTGQLSVSIAADQTTGLDIGQYRLRVQVVTESGLTVPAPDMNLVLQGSSTNTGIPYTSYCTYQDMLDYYPSLAGLQADSDVQGFARQRDKARKWVERVIQRNRSNARGSTMLGVGGSTIHGWTGWNLSQDDPTLKGYLDNDLLLRKPILVEMTAKKTLAYVLQAQLTPIDKESQYRGHGIRFEYEAEALACIFVAEIDLNGDGWADLVIPCGQAGLR